MPVHGLLANTLAAYSPLASHVDTAQDLIFRHIHGSDANTTGDGVGAGSTATNLITDGTETYAVGDILPVVEATSNRVRWVRVTAVSSASDYTVTTMSTAPATAAELAGARSYGLISGGQANTMSFSYRLDNIGIYHFAGGRCTSATLKMDTESIITLDTTWKGSVWVLDPAKVSLPVSVAAASVRPMVGVKSPLWINGTQTAIGTMEMDYGLSTSEVLATEADEGLVGNAFARHSPTIKVTPQYDTFFETLTGDQDVLIQCGGGDTSGGGYVNSVCIHAPICTMAPAKPTADGTLIRHELEFKVQPGQGLRALTVAFA